MLAIHETVSGPSAGMASGAGPANPGMSLIDGGTDYIHILEIYSLYFSEYFFENGKIVFLERAEFHRLVRKCPDWGLGISHRLCVRQRARLPTVL
nr:hypothetical protein [uncultured Azospirillum sp.]